MNDVGSDGVRVGTLGAERERNGAVTLVMFGHKSTVAVPRWVVQSAIKCPRCDEPLTPVEDSLDDRAAFMRCRNQHEVDITLRDRVPEKMFELPCSTCGTLTQMTYAEEAQRRRSGEVFACPNGHGMVFTHDP